MELTKREDYQDFLVKQGGEVKAAPDGRVSGYLITFSDETSPDLSGDFFTKDTDFGPHNTTMTLYHHGLDVKVGDRVIGKGEMKVDELGVWIEAQLEMRDKYEKAIYVLAQKGKLGWSSGTAPHLVKREQKGNAQRILSWPLGLDASLTPAPAEPRNVAISMKSVEVSDIETLTEPEAAGDAAAQSQIQSAVETEGVTQMEEQKEEQKSMEQSVLDKVAEAQAVALKEKTEREERERKMAESIKSIVDAAVKNAPPVEMGARLNLKAPKGDDAMKAFNHWIKTGDNGGLRAAPEYKTDYNLVEGTQYQGQELVPTEIVNKIYALRDPNSIARAAGAIVIPVSAASVNVPYERTRQAVPVSTAEAAAYDILENQIFDKKAVTIVKYTRNVPITEELMEDAVVDFVPFVTGQLARAFAQLENTVFLTASTGAWYGSTKGLDFDSATAIAVAEIPELYHKLSQEYRAGSVWLGTKATEGYIRGLNTAYAFPFAGNGGWSGAMGDVNKGLGAGPLLNSPFYNWSGVEEIGAEHKSLMIGNFNAGYVILERRGMTVVRDTTTGIKEGLIYLLASCRIGGGVTIAEAFQHGLHPTG